MGGNQSTQIAAAITTRDIRTSVRTAYENVQKNTNLAKLTQDVEIVQSGGFIQTADVNQKQNARLKVSAFSDSAVKSALANDVLSEMKANLTNSGLDPGLLGGIFNNTTLMTTAQDNIISSVDVGLNMVSQQISENTADLTQRAKIQQLASGGNFTFLQSAAVNQDQSYDALIDATSQAILSSEVGQKITGAMQATLDQKLSGPLDAIAETVKQGLWGTLLAIIAPFALPVIIVVVLIGVAIAWKMSSGPKVVVEETPPEI